MLECCEWALELPCALYTRSASERREAGESGVWEYNDLTELLEAEATDANQNFLAISFRLAAEGSGEEPSKK